MNFQCLRIVVFKLISGSLLLLPFCFQSCVKDEINNLSGNVNFQQDFSIPLGGKELFLEAPSITDTSSVPGRYGNYYYNGLPYPCDFSVFPPIFFTVNFNLNSKGKIDLVKRVEFLVVCENSFPTKASLEIFLVDANGNSIGQFFKNTIDSVDAGETNSNGEVIRPGQKVYDVVYDDLTILKQTTHLEYKILIFNDFTGNFNNSIRLTDKNNFKVTIGARAQLDYNVKDL